MGTFMLCDGAVTSTHTDTARGSLTKPLEGRWQTLTIHSPHPGAVCLLT